MTPPSDGGPSWPADPPAIGERLRAGRAALVADATLGGRALTRALADHIDGWFHWLGAGLPRGWALVATGGYGRAHLFPGSDVDVLLIHPRPVSADGAADTARALWYPMWDAGVKLSPAVHHQRSVLQLADGDLHTSTALLDLRHLAGDALVTAELGAAARRQWATRPWKWLGELHHANLARWATAGDVSALLEPNLKDGRGGLRDVDTVRWALAMHRDDVSAALDLPADDLALGAAPLVQARAEVHRITGRSANTLLLQDQDAVAAACQCPDADRFMLGLSAAARRIEWAARRFWDRTDELVVRARRRSRRRRGASTTGDVDLPPGAPIDDPALTLRVAADAAFAGRRLSRGALLQMANGRTSEGATWSEPTRRAFLTLLGCGPALVDTVDTLEFHGLFSRYVPEWRAIHSLPQRNAFHRYTVDRHLLQTVVEAARLMRSVSRPDLLLTAALLHDIGKGRLEDHTDLGVRLTTAIATRMGFTAPDVDVLARLVRCHLLLAETATRRDLDDPRTAHQVAEQVGSLSALHLLETLTEADGRATGPTSWTPWKARLVQTLVERTAATFRGEPSPPEPVAWAPHVEELARHAASTGALELRYWPAGGDGELGTVAVATPDQAGLFATIAGGLALHGVSVIGAQVGTTPDGLAVDRFQVLDGDDVNWGRVEQALRRTIGGDLDLDDRIRVRLSTPRLRRRGSPAEAVTEIHITNQASASATMVDVRSPDAEAVLYRLAVVLRDRGLDIHSAKVATLGHEVVDVFYVRHNGGQLPEPEHEQLRAELTAALAT